MPPSTKSKDQLRAARFILNMGRINGLLSLINSGIDRLKPKGFAESDGPRADILRAIVVFLHATFEDVLRSSDPSGRGRRNFYSGTDIDNALKKWGLDPKPFEALYPPLTEMAERRQRIVHEADLPRETDTVQVWSIADEWRLIMWTLAVPAFHSLLLSVLNPEDVVSRETHKRLTQAMAGFLVFGKELATMGEPTQDLTVLRQKLQRALDVAHGVIATLRA
jgi:hypothetical protein